MKTGDWLRRTEVLLLMVALLCAVYSGVVEAKAAAARRESASFGQAAGRSASEDGQRVVGQVHVDADAGHGGQASVMGKLEIPAIGLTVPIMSDYQSGSLLKGVGYIPGTALPGGLGTLGLAGHRDTYFRPLSRIRKAMDVRVADVSGTYHYEVDSTEIVKPENVSVLDIRNRPELTLITCYPFHYIGAAPLRFIVHAHLLSVIPD